MVEIGVLFFISVFIAGVLMFLAPCSLPLVPAYLAFISGVKNEELANPKTRARARRAILLNGGMFVLGFTTIFVGFGLLAGLFGAQIGQFRNVLSQVGGGFIIIFGLMMLQIINIAPLMREHRLKMPAILTPGKPSSAFIMGSVFALGWTPCVGPVLASVLLLASTSTTVFSGGFLLAVFSLGLAVPFIITAVLFARASHVIATYSGVTKWVGRVGGAFLIFIGILLFTDNFGLTVEYGYKVFNFFGLDGLFELL